MAADTVGRGDDPDEGVTEDAGTLMVEDPGVVGDRFELGERLGRGASATVYRAHDRMLGRAVALKLFAPGIGTLESSSVRREIQAAAAVTHPNVLEIFDVGEVDDRVFLVMRLVPGGSLADALENGPLPPGVVVPLAGELLGALAHVHALGIVHRDVKPANVLLDPGEGEEESVPDDAPVRIRPVLADFGVAAVATATTVHGQVSGTAAYLAPEQVRGDDVSAPADVYALGLVLLECLTGRREFPGGPVESSVARLHRAPLVPDDLPGGLRDLLVAMTASAASDRPTAERAQELLRGAAPEGSVEEQTLAVAPAALAAVDGLPARSPIVIGGSASGGASDTGGAVAGGDAAAPGAFTAATAATGAAGPALGSAATAGPGPALAGPDLVTGPIRVPTTPASPHRGRRLLLAGAVALLLAGGVVGGVVLTGASSPLTATLGDPVPAAPVTPAPPPPTPLPAPPPVAAPSSSAPASTTADDPAGTTDEDGDDGGDAPLPAAPAPAPGATPAPAPCRTVLASLASGRVVFTNRGATACTLQGFPAVSLVGKGGTVGKPASHTGARGAVATLAPGGSVTAAVQIVAPSEFGDRCKPVAVTGLRVRAPGVTAAVTLPRDARACSGPITRPQLVVAAVG